MVVTKLCNRQTHTAVRSVDQVFTTVYAADVMMMSESTEVIMLVSR